MKLFIQSPDANGYVDPPVANFLRMLPDRVHVIEASDVVLVPITRFDSFVCDTDGLSRLLESGKPWVLWDMEELGWDWDQQHTHRWGDWTSMFPCYQDRHEYLKFSKWVGEHPPAMMFKRELLKKDVSTKLQPLAYPVLHPVQEPVSLDEYARRPFLVFNSWGRSSEKRMHLHGDFFRAAGECRFDVVTEFSHMDSVPRTGRLVATIHSPHYARIPMERLLAYQAMSQVSVSLNGAGAICFRHSEACLNSLMAKEDDEVAYPFPWTYDNSILLAPNKKEGWAWALTYEWESVESRYRKYCEGLRNAQNYLPMNMYQRHILPALQAVL